MRVFVTGATGAIGTRLVPQLVERGHHVIGATRSPAKSERVRELGAEPVVLDLLDARAVREVVLAAQPDAIVHEATALAGVTDFKHFDRSFAETNRLRTKGTDTLLAAAGEVGAGRFVAQSFAGWPYARIGGPVKTEEDPLDPTPVPAMRNTLAAIRHLEEAGLPFLARTLGAKPPRHVPRGLAKLAAGDATVVLMTEARGASNATAKRELGWTLAYPSWRQGFVAAYGGRAAAPGRLARVA